MTLLKSNKDLCEVEDTTAIKKLKFGFVNLGIYIAMNLVVFELT